MGQSQTKQVSGELERLLLELRRELVEDRGRHTTRLLNLFASMRARGNNEIFLVYIMRAPRLLREMSRDERYYVINRNLTIIIEWIDSISRN